MDRGILAKRLTFGRNCLTVLPSWHSHSSGPRGPIDLDSFCRASAHHALGARFFKYLRNLISNQRLPFENGFTKSVRKTSLLRQIWRWPSLNGHNSVPRGPIDLNSFPMDRPLPGLGDGHRKWPKSPFLARVISVQKIPTKWYFWAFFLQNSVIILVFTVFASTVRILAVFS